MNYGKNINPPIPSNNTTNISSICLIIPVNRNRLLYPQLLYPDDDKLFYCFSPFTPKYSPRIVTHQYLNQKYIVCPIEKAEEIWKSEIKNKTTEKGEEICAHERYCTLCNECMLGKSKRKMYVLQGKYFMKIIKKFNTINMEDVCYFTRINYKNKEKNQILYGFCVPEEVLSIFIYIIIYAYFIEMLFTKETNKIPRRCIEDCKYYFWNDEKSGCSRKEIHDSEMELDRLVMNNNALPEYIVNKENVQKEKNGIKDKQQVEKQKKIQKQATAKPLSPFQRLIQQQQKEIQQRQLLQRPPSILLPNQSQNSIQNQNPPQNQQEKNIFPTIPSVCENDNNNESNKSNKNRNSDNFTSPNDLTSVSNSQSFFHPVQSSPPIEVIQQNEANSIPIQNIIMEYKTFTTRVKRKYRNEVSVIPPNVDSKMKKILNDSFCEIIKEKENKESNANNICLKCKTILRKEAKFCDNCGEKVKMN